MSKLNEKRLNFMEMIEEGEARNAPKGFRAQTANGTARFAPVRLDRVQIGDIVVQDVEAAVAEPGKLRTTLLGMSFLGRLQRVDMRAGTMVLAD